MKPNLQVLKNKRLIAAVLVALFGTLGASGYIPLADPLAAALCTAIECE